ncbi:MAG: tRNA pseudouridine(55) synthase TruB [bacterium]|nr:tRNA pseudouridine(55) synthase TruB [bacterium]
MQDLQNAVILIDKPVGRTSFETVSQVKRLLKVKKIGHSGTLDKFASGLLVLCTGRATRLTNYFLESDKEYSGIVQLGIATDTCDIYGDVITNNPFAHITEEEIKNALNSFKGEIMQMPPLYSALKINGQRASDLVRNGKEVEIKERQITIYNIESRHIDRENGRVSIYVSSSKGTYIRSIARDMGEILGTGAHLASLRRLKSGHFSIENAVTIEELREFIEKGTQEKDFIVSPVNALQKFSCITVNNAARNRIVNGAYFDREDALNIDINEINEKKLFIIVDEDKNLIAIAEIDIEKWHIKYRNVFN